MLLEKQRISQFCGISLQFRPKLFQTPRTVLLEFTKKFFPATQNSFSRESFSPENSPSTIFSSSTILFFLLSFLFLLTISRPPRGYAKTKKVLHTLLNPHPGKPPRNKP